MKYIEKGTGQPIIFLHGFCEAKEIWRTFLDYFSKTNRVICPDLPGFGSSPLHQDSVTLEQVAELLQNWMMDLNLDKPIVIGHSLGGYITLALAELMGQQLSAIGLFHSSALSDNPEKKANRNKTLDFVKKNGTKKFLDTFIPSLFAANRKGILKEEIELAFQLGEKASKKGFIAYTEAMRDRKDRTQVLKDFEGKKLYIAGELDQAIPLEISRKHREIVDIYHELHDTGHMGMLERKTETILFIKEFIEYSNQ